MNQHLCLSLFVIYLSVAFLAPAHSLERDGEQPLHVKARSVHLDENTGVAVYTGDVVAIQGNLRIDADRIEVRRDHSQIQTLIAIGKPVRMRGRIDANQDEWQGRAERLVYNVKAREIDLTGDVWFRQGYDQFSATHVNYLLDNRKLLADGTADERVYAIFGPPANPQANKAP